MKERFASDPEYYLRYCKSIESELNVRFKLILNDTPEATHAKQVRKYLPLVYEGVDILVLTIRDGTKIEWQKGLTRQTCTDNVQRRLSETHPWKW